MKFHLVIKNGPDEIQSLYGRTVAVTAADLEKVTEVEAFLERLYGFRFHINLIGNIHGTSA